MSSIELTSSQKSILTALINLYGEQEDAVKGEAIAEEVDRNPGTIRNQMQSLKALQLVEGVPGPKGGYKPTSNAYEALDIQRWTSPPTSHLPRGRGGHGRQRRRDRPLQRSPPRALPRRDPRPGLRPRLP